MRLRTLTLTLALGTVAACCGVALVVGACIMALEGASVTVALWCAWILVVGVLSAIGASYAQGR